jgi:2-iminobutanoate/2-iminopropanoate deaminase
MAKQAITTDRVAPPVGPFSPAARDAGGRVYLSGQVAQDPLTGKLIEGDVGRQTEQALQNARAVIEAAGLTFADVQRVGVYLTDMRDFQAMNAVYARFFEPPYPARTTVAVAALPLGARVEVDMVAGQ